MTESEIKREICEWLEAKNYFFWVQVSGGMFGGRTYSSRFVRKGVPDIVGMYNGRLLGIEVKKPGGKVALHQEKFLEAINKFGGLGFVAYSLDDVIEKLEMEK